MPWFQRRRAVAEQEQRRLWRLARMKTDMRQITSQMNELEAVDSFNAIEKHISEEVKVSLRSLRLLISCSCYFCARFFYLGLNALSSLETPM